MVRCIVSGIPEVLWLASWARSAYLLAMSEAQPAVAEIAALVGNPARANILMALIEGRALTASELSYVAGVSPQTTSEHLAMLRTGSFAVCSHRTDGIRSVVQLAAYVERV
jgi:ethanolamine utilization microcompartment shell protein EutL